MTGMGTPTPDFHGLAASMSCAEQLLPDLGRVAWAATRLRADVGAALAERRGPRPGPSRYPAPYPSLAEDLRELEAIAEGTVVAEWCRTIGAHAVAAHDAVVHEILRLHAPLNVTNRVVCLVLARLVCRCHSSLTARHPHASNLNV